METIVWYQVKSEIQNYSIVTAIKKYICLQPKLQKELRSKYI